MKTGFTLIETITIVAVLVVLISIAIPVMYGLEKDSSLSNSVNEVVSALRLVQTRALGSKGNAPWGVYFDTGVAPHQYTLFQGENYISREQSLDEVHRLPGTVEFSSLGLEGGAAEIVFDKITGRTSQFGAVVLDFKQEVSDPRTIYIKNSGNISLTAFSVSDADRVKDSRHVHFTYSRTGGIDTAIESIVLTFEGGVVENIPISSNVEGGQISWQGVVEVAGEEQRIEIHTHSLNAPDTVFCVHRDLRYNTKALDIDITGDIKYPEFSPVLLQFLSDNSTVKGSSSFVSDPIWQ